MAAVNSVGTSPQSSEVSAITIPPVPASLAATAGNAQVSLTWSASTGAASYTLYRGTTSGGETQLASGVTTASYTDTGVTNGTAYYYKVAAVDASGASGLSGEVSATPAVPPATPTGLTATGGSAQVSLSWGASTGATSYNVYRGASAGSETLLQSGITSTSYTNTGLSAGTTYFYKVAAVNSGGTSTQSSEVSAITIPAAPTGLAATAGNAQVSLSWTASTGAASYAVYRGTTSGGETQLASGVTTAGYTDTGVSNGTTYYYKVAAVNPSGTSGLSSEVSATPQALPGVSSLSPTSGLVATSVTITGTNFGVMQGTSAVTFNGTAATPTSWSATSIVAPVPNGATSGSVVVTVGGMASNGVAFTVGVPLLVKAGRFVQPASTGDQAITGLGFKPNVVLFWMTNNTADGSLANMQLGVGAATGSSQQWYYAGSAMDASTSFVAIRRLAQSAIGTVAAGGSIALAEGQLKSLDPDGFTVTWTTSDSRRRIVTYLALSGLTNAYAGYYTTPTSVGAKAITGVGFQPDAVLLMGPAATSTCILPCQGASYLRYGVGYASSPSTAVNSDFFFDESTLVSSSYQRPGDIAADLSGTSLAAEALLQSLDPDGFTLNYTTDTASSRYQFFVALKGARFYAGSFNQATSTGSQSITSPGFRPDAVLFASGNRASSTAVASGAELSLGMATSPTNRFSIFVGGNSDGTHTHASQSIDSSTALKLMTASGATPTTQAAFDFVSNDASGFTINNTVTDGTSREIPYLAVGSTVSPVAPAISSLSPASGPVGTSVTITGTSFGATQGSSTVTFNGNAATPASWSATSITAPVPAGATAGNVVLIVNGQSSNGTAFTVTTQ